MLTLIEIFFNVITPVYAVVAIGYLAAPRLQLQARTLSRLAYYVLIPAFVFNVVVAADVPAALLLQTGGFSLLTIGGITVITYLVGRLLKLTRKRLGAYLVVAAFANVGNFGLPIITFRFGDEAVEIATIYFLMIMSIAFVISVGAASWATGGSLRAVIDVFKTPALLALPPALALNLANVTPPLLLNRITSLLGNAMVPIMLVALGVQLYNVAQIKLDRHTLILSAIRLIGTPLLALPIAPLFQLTGVVRGAGIIQTAMPAAVLCSIIALEYDLLPDFVTTTVLFSTLMSVITLSLVLFVA